MCSRYEGETPIRLSVWWGLITLALCGLCWLAGRRSRPPPPAGIGPWAPSWAVYFSPNGGALEAIIQCIRGAKKTILVQVHLFYSVPLAGVLVRAHQRGVQVQIMLDAGAQPFDPPVRAVAYLVAAKMAVFLDDHHSRAHDKVMILDEEIVITGSYNWTMAAEKDNSENLLVIHNPHLARLYTAHWQRHAQHSFRYRARISWQVRLRYWFAWLRHVCGRLRRWHREVEGHEH
jgi:phosphatidylserine/phosphatidylglycerophosphate/cardiolipin synthase-like enzyme